MRSDATIKLTTLVPGLHYFLTHEDAHQKILEYIETLLLEIEELKGKS